MLKPIPPLIAGLLLLLIASPSSASYITDKLAAGLYENPETTETPIQVLPSGTPLELIESQEGFSHVRLTDRTEGWVETEFLTDEKPAQIMLLELQATTGELRHKLQQAEAELEEATPEQERLKNELIDASQRIEELSQQLNSTQAKAAEYGGILALPLWLLPAAALLALFGFVGGAIFRNYRLRKRLGGLRL